MTAPKGAARENASSERCRNRGEMAGNEDNSEESAKAAGALCTMMAKKMTRSREVSSEEASTIGALIEEAPRDMPSAKEWTSSPTTVEKAEAATESTAEVAAAGGRVRSGEGVRSFGP